MIRRNLATITTQLHTEHTLKTYWKAMKVGLMLSVENNTRTTSIFIPPSSPFSAVPPPTTVIHPKPNPSYLWGWRLLITCDNSIFYWDPHLFFFFFYWQKWASVDLSQINLACVIFIFLHLIRNILTRTALVTPWPFHFRLSPRHSFSITPHILHYDFHNMQTNPSGEDF